MQIACFLAFCDMHCNSICVLRGRGNALEACRFLVAALYECAFYHFVAGVTWGVAVLMNRSATAGYT